MKRRPARQIVSLGLVLAGMLLAQCRCAFALDPSLDVSQYAHTAWKIREGFAKGTIYSIAQTPDGYLWLGTEFGLLRFDGVRSVPWQPSQGQPLSSSRVLSLLAARDGTLWIGTTKGLASWKGSKLTQYPELAGESVFRLIEDREGNVWAGGITTPGKLCEIRNVSVHCYGQDGTLGPGVYGLYEDSKGNLWVGVRNGLWRWKPGSSNFYAIPDNLDDIRAFAEADDGALLLSTRTGIQRLVNGKLEAYSLPGNVQHFRTETMLRDRDGGLWIATSEYGLLHVHQGRTDAFSSPDGLSGNSPYPIFEDREGNIWVATFEGLDRFRDFAVATLSANQGVSGVNGAVLADRDGSVWIGTHDGLVRWNNGQVTIPPTGSAKRDGKLNGDSPGSLFQDARGRVWVSTRHDLGYLEGDRFLPVSAVPGGFVHSIAEDTAGNLWIANQELGLFRLSPQGEVQQIPWAGLGHKDHAQSLTADPFKGGLWLGFYKDGVAYFSDGGVRASYTVGNGLGEGRVRRLQLDRDGTVWAATEGGLSRLKDDHVATLTGKNGLPCDVVHWMIEDNDHFFWLYMPCGLVRVARSELDARADAIEKGKDTSSGIQATVFDITDGVRTVAGTGGYTPQVAKASDGKLWFSAANGISVVDPRHIAFNMLAPPVHIEQITADHKTYDVPSDANGSVHLPPRLRDLEIDYTALSLVAPEKVFFRYKLEGWDSDWQNAGTRRQAFYNNLPPRSYRFRVMGCNNSGVWNEAGSSRAFSVAPAYYQTAWFRLSCVVAFLALLYALYQLRLHQLSRQFNIRLEERVAERTRIARDLHDTMLQSFQGVMLKLYALTSILDRPTQARETLEGLLDEGQQAIDEGRDAVRGMRSSAIVQNDLARALAVVGERLAAEQNAQNPVDFRVVVEGDSRDLHPILRDEVYRIASEATCNSFRHSGARRIEIQIFYDKKQLRVRVQDNGKGIDAHVLDGGGRVGHYGLPGMQERAKLAGGKLTVRSRLDSGTEVELTIPASIAYAKSSDPSPSIS